MLTTDKEENRDFDVNNLFLNLDFQHQEETFEYKWALLDHPSNYQMIVTKLLTRTSLPYIKLHETKKTIQDVKTAWIEPGEQIFFDYTIKLRHSKDIDEEMYMQNIFTYNYTDKQIHDKCYVIKKDKLDITNVKDFLSWDEMADNREKPFYWFNTSEHRNIYSLDQIYQMISNALCAMMKNYIKDHEHDKDYFATNIVSKIFKLAEPIFMILEDNVPRLYIVKELFISLLTPGNDIDTENAQRKNLSLYFSKNLFKFLKGLPIKPCSNYKDEFCKLEVTEMDLICAEDKSYTVYRKNEDSTEEKITIKYKIFKGEKLNIMELSDYIGLAITSPDFPIKEQIYPQFDYDFEDNFFKENRRRYVPYSETCIIDALGRNNEIYKFEKQNITDLVKYSTGDKILFVKYFDSKTEDLNAINYENNNSATTLKMDLMNVMPLKRFTLKLYLIDRYNNFEPLYPKIEGFDDVIKLQLLFTRIKGDEKENRNIIETKKEKPDKYLLELFDIPEEEEEKPQFMSERKEENEPQIILEPQIIEPENPNIDDILPDIGNVPIPEEKQPNIDDILPDIGDVPLPENNDEEEDFEPPPEKMMYINNENEEDEDYDENGLY